MNKNFKTEENIDIDSFNSYNINACQINSDMRDNRKRKDSYSTLDLNEINNEMDDILNFNFFNSRNLDAGEENLEYDIWEKHKFDETSIFTEKLKGLIDSNIRGPSYQQDSNCHSKFNEYFTSTSGNKTSTWNSNQTLSTNESQKEDQEKLKKKKNKKKKKKIIHTYVNNNTINEIINRQTNYNQNLIQKMNHCIMMGCLTNPMLAVNPSPFIPINFNIHKNYYINNNDEAKMNLKKKNKKKDPFQDLRTASYSQIDDESNRINLESILRGKDKRTTIMIRNIPNKYNIKSFTEEINEDFTSKYDVFYLPIDYQNRCNLGFAFINFVDPMHLILFYDMYRAKKWKKFKSDKICELAYAKFQGRYELKKHFEKGSLMYLDSEDKKPLIFDPPTILPKVEIPMKFIEAFKIVYPFGSIIINGDKFCIEKYYNF